MSTYNYSYSAPPFPAHFHEPSGDTIVGAGSAPKDVEEARGTGRTPSPTPTEANYLANGLFDPKAMMSWRYWFRKEWLWWYILSLVGLVLGVLMTVYHKQIVQWLTPATRWMQNLKFGWLIPIGILFVISFPPLFGHEIVAVLCGVVWGLGKGFAIVAAGTFLGEVGNFYAFKYLCRARSEKAERNNIRYACLAQVVREGGFKIALIARLSAIPGHFTTGIFATCGMGIITFCIAALLSLPKQLVTVYLGVLLEPPANTTTGGTTAPAPPVDTTSRIISDVVVAITVIITFAAMWYIYRQMNNVVPDVIYKMRKARQAKLVRQHLYAADSETTLDNTLQNNNSYVNFENPAAFNPHQSDSDIPLQQWDAQGKAVGYAQDPNLYAPQPRRISNVPKLGQHAVRQSTEEVGWDLGARGISAASSPRQQPQLPHGLKGTRFSEEFDQPTPTQAGFPSGAGPSSPRTATQATFVGGSSSPRLHNPYAATFDAYGSSEGPPGYGAGAAAARSMSPARGPDSHSYAVPQYRTVSPMGQGVSHRTSYHESDLR